MGISQGGVVGDFPFVSVSLRNFPFVSVSLRNFPFVIGYSALDLSSLGTNLILPPYIVIPYTHLFK